MKDERLLSESDVIFRYTRKQAIEDGVLVDLSDWARETGFKFPVACTRGVWEQCIVPPEETVDLGQSERGRAHDLLWMLFTAIRRGKGGERVDFQVLFLQSARARARPTLTDLKALCGPGDDGEPVITVLLPNED